ncbi:hypothetical protein MKW92_050785 [Papaver armeniacum]|nr:hypothetical protein MKW92_050785 [Papaver armeniacum]
MIVACGSLIGLASGTTKRLYIPSLNGFFNKTLGEFWAGKIHVLIACRSHGVGISKWGAFGPDFASRSMTTDACSREPVSCFTNYIAPPRIKFKMLDKTARHIMQIVNKEQVQAVKEHRDFPDIQPGYTVQLKVNKRRVSALKVTLIARRNAGLHSTFRIRRMVAGVVIESLFPLYSPNIKEMQVLNKNKTRRQSLTISGIEPEGKPSHFVLSR